MLRNDYRRALIVLRPLTRGMNGHVRLERRTLAGTMRFTVQGADGGTLNALLMADTPGGWQIYHLGTLSSDARGQSGMTATFDPRSLNGMDIDDYALVALVKTGAGAPELVMTGMVNGSKAIDWASATAAAVGEYRPARAADIQPIMPLEMQVECCCNEIEEMPPEAEMPPEEMVSPVVMPEPETVPLPEMAPEIEDETEQMPETEMTACELLGICDEAVWPECIEAIQTLFENELASNAFQLEDFVFVDAPLPGEDGTQGQCAIGLKALDGAPVSVCYALPGAYSVEPPPGLEDYQYLGGWWYTVLTVIEGQEELLEPSDD